MNTEKTWGQRFMTSLKKDIKDNPKQALAAAMLFGLVAGVSAERYVYNPISELFTDKNHETPSLD